MSNVETWKREYVNTWDGGDVGTWRRGSVENVIYKGKRAPAHCRHDDEGVICNRILNRIKKEKEG